jgi:hypothetical protein
MLEKITPTLVADPLGQDQVTKDCDNMEIELDEKELAEIDLVSLEEAYRKQELLSITLRSSFRKSIKYTLIPPLVPPLDLEWG